MHSSNEPMTIQVPIFPAANHNDEGHLSLYWWWSGYRVFHEETTRMRATCPSIDGNKDADKLHSEYKNNIPIKTSWQCAYAHAMQFWGNGQFQQTNDNTDIKLFLWQTTIILMKEIRPSIVDDMDTGRVFHEQTTMMRVACRSIDGNKDADKFNTSEYYKNSIPNAETSDMKKKL